MESILLLYIFITGLVYISWLWDSTDPFWIKLFNILFGFMEGWIVTPILIGKAIAQIYEEQ